MKKIILLFVLLIVFSIRPNIVKADNSENEYNIKNLDMEINLQSNGDAIIQETWEINFIRGDYSSFYISRYKNVSDFEEFSDLKVNEVLIDGTPINRTEFANEKPENTYFLNEDSSLYYYYWFFKANNETKKLTINYTLKNVVKEYKDEAIFIYRFVGMHFEHNIEKVNIKINPPINSKILNGVKEESLSVTVPNHSGLLKFKTVLSLEGFSNLTKLKDLMPGTIIGLIIIIIIVISILSIINYICSPNLIIKKHLKRNPLLISELEDSFKNISSSKLYMFNKTKSNINHMKLFELIFLDLIKKQVLKIIDSKIIFTSNDLEEFEDLFIKSFELDKLETDIESLIRLLENKDFFKERMTEIINLIDISKENLDGLDTSLYCNYLSSDFNEKETYESFTNIILKLSEGKKLDTVSLHHFSFSSQSNSRNIAQSNLIQGTSGLILLAVTIDSLYYTNYLAINSSSSSGTGCGGGGCGGCGGCGGGG